MTNTYQWTQITPSGLNSMSVDGQALSKVFTVIDWRMTGTDGINTVGAYGQVSLAPPNPAAFVPAASVTQAQLIGWLAAALGASGIAAAKAQIDAGISELAAPPTFTGTTIAGVAC